MSGGGLRVQPKRKHANTHPGDIVNKAAQHRCTQDKIEADKAKKQAAKETKLKHTQEKHDKQVNAAAAAEQKAHERAVKEKEKETCPDLTTAAAATKHRSPARRRARSSRSLADCYIRAELYKERQCFLAFAGVAWCFSVFGVRCL
ncbi:hypothetical protein GGX14DRAFT_394191 [Mycena pura]|uniref:Uncharacterized protein n=1 Tax=Mycena pura TaxID=153505 RepID=A0AAD6YFX4_9AGAR|nr:hypothetical protein GGX14DRAFT_394191 [Mycena pura]